jgi:hypothetical protein
MFLYLGWDEAILAGQLSVDLAKLPAMAEIAPARGPMLIKFLLAVMWFLLSVAMFATFAPAPMRIKMFMLVPSLGGIIMIGMTLYGLMRRRRVKFGEDRVVVQDRHWWRNVAWSAPYLAFQGVRLRKKLINGGPTNRIFHIVELTHPNPTMSLPLLVTHDEPPPRSALVSVAKLFGLSVLDEGDAGEIFLTQAKAFNRPLRDLAHDHNLADLYDTGEPLPRELQMKHGGDNTLALTVWPRRPSRVWQAVLIVGSALLLLFSLALTNIVVLVDILVVVAIAAYVLLNGVRRRRRLIVSHEELIYEPPAWGSSAKTSSRVKLSNVRGIYIERPQTGGLPHIEIRTAQDSVHLGHGLSPASLDWLRRFLLSAIVTA